MTRGARVRGHATSDEIRQAREHAARMISVFMADPSVTTYDMIASTWPKVSDRSCDAALHIMKVCANDEKRRVPVMSQSSWMRLLGSAQYRLAAGDSVDIEVLSWAPMDRLQMAAVACAAACVFGAVVWSLR